MVPAFPPIPDGRGRPVWLVTLADLVALMLTFFVLIFSMSSIRSDDWSRIAEGLPAGAPVEVAAQDRPPGANSNVETLEIEPGLDLRYLEAVLREQFPQDRVMREAVLGRTRDALVVSLPAHLLFESASDRLTSGADTALFRLGGLLANLKNDIAVIGHTDPQPITTERFPSNWELSLSRALTVAGALRQAGYPHSLQVLGVAESRFADLPPSLGEAGRHALARRVDLLIRDMKEH